MEQVSTVVAPTAPENLPASHSVQTVDAMAAEYLPAQQSAQTKGERVLFVATRYLPATQLVQMVDPEILCTHSITHNSVQFFASQHITITYVCVYQSRSLSLVEEPIVREQVCVLHRVGLLKLTSMIGRFDTYKGGV